MLYLPIAHAEGKVLCRNQAVRGTLHEQRLIALQYVDERGNFGGYPVNPNGSQDHIAGLTDITGRILGMMPHPERFTHPTHHPHWPRLSGLPEPCGIDIFRNAVEFLRSA